MVQIGRDLRNIVDFDQLRAAEFFSCFTKSARMHGLWEEMESSVLREDFSAICGIREVFILSPRWIFFAQLISILAAQFWIFSHPLVAFTDLHNHTQVRQSAWKINSSFLDHDIIQGFRECSIVTCYAEVHLISRCPCHVQQMILLFFPWQVVSELQVFSASGPSAWGPHQHKDCRF